MKTCFICNRPLDGLRPHAVICGKPDCVRERNRLKARKHGAVHLWGRAKECVVCGEQFFTSKKNYTICSDDCRAKRRKDYPKKG